MPLPPCFAQVQRRGAPSLPQKTSTPSTSRNCLPWRPRSPPAAASPASLMPSTSSTPQPRLHQQMSPRRRPAEPSEHHQNRAAFPALLSLRHSLSISLLSHGLSLCALRRSTPPAISTPDPVALVVPCSDLQPPVTSLLVCAPGTRRWTLPCCASPPLFSVLIRAGRTSGSAYGPPLLHRLKAQRQGVLQLGLAGQCEPPQPPSLLGKQGQQCIQIRLV